ncbi:unnamed protein product [Schistosoma curassoni]|uniref:Kringle domain-containing protein n=1 Tax=Schistosoma curassoni TaxID=6186 RepID=A0A183KKP1_9TREM|nr:unnamed protein product [Schistosoma curassoni]
MRNISLLSLFPYSILAEHIGCYEGNGADYNGDQDQTSDGQPCAKWRISNSRKEIGPIYRYRLQYNETTSKLLSTSDYELDNFRSCRNPGGVKSQPWCYPIKVRGVSSGIQHCDIPKCCDVLAGTHKQNLPEFLSELVLPVWYSNRQPTEFNQYQKTRQI